MNATTIAIDLAKSVFQLAVADEHWRIVETQRLTRMQFERWFANRSVGLVIMEACGSVHHWTRWINVLGIEVHLLPAKSKYVRRNKTDVSRRGRPARSRPRFRHPPLGAGVQGRSSHNKATCALANKLARICYATLRDKTPFGETERLNRKITRETFVMPD